MSYLWRNQELPNRKVGGAMMFDTWICHVCGKERPDSKISVYSTTKIVAGNFPIKQNVRFCNDNPKCIEGATQVDFMGAA